MVIAFSHTTPALLAGRKTCTRRNWKPRTVEYFTNRLTMATLGIATDAYDKSPRNGGRKVATIAVESVAMEPLSAMPDSDYEAEGFAWLHEQGVDLGDVWDIVPSRQYPSLSKLHAPNWQYFHLAQQCMQTRLWVVRFQLLEVCE